jgi:hypothetical protein
MELINVDQKRKKKIEKKARSTSREMKPNLTMAPLASITSFKFNKARDLGHN